MGETSSILDSIQLLLRVIVTENTPLGRALVIVLAIMAAIGARYALSHTRRYRRLETGYLNQAKTHLKNLRGNGSESADEQAAKRLTNLVSADELAQAVSADSIIGDRLRMVALLRQSQTKVNLAALQQLSRAREGARVSLRFPGMAVNLLMLVGLLGTFIGIAIVIQQIGANISLGDGSLQSFGKAFSGMYTKFSTTLVGLAGAILLASLNFRLAQAQEQFFEDLDRFTVSELLPATIPALEDETLLERISQQLEKSFTRIEEIATKNADTAEDVAAIQAGFTDIINKMRDQTRGEGPDHLQNLLGQMAGVIGQVSRLSDGLHTLATELPKALAQSGGRMADTGRSVGYTPEFTVSGGGQPSQTKVFLAFGAAAAVGAVVAILFITFAVKG